MPWWRKQKRVKELGLRRLQRFVGLGVMIREKDKKFLDGTVKSLELSDLGLVIRLGEGALCEPQKDPIVRDGTDSVYIAAGLKILEYDAKAPRLIAQSEIVEVTLGELSRKAPDMCY